LIASLLFGAAAVVAFWAGKPYLMQAFLRVEKDLADKLRRLRTSSRRLRSYLVAWLVITVCAMAAMAFAAGSIVFAVMSGVFLICAPWYLLRRMAERRRQKIEDQLADAMVGLANAVRAGLSLAQSLEILAAQCPSPINSEFHQIIGEYKLGKPLERTLTEARQRLKSENFALFAAALMASHESGGRLNETVERIAHSVLELQRLERKITSETAQARRSAVYMAIAPAFILVAYWFIDPVNTKMLFTRFFGQCILAAAVLLDVIAYAWASFLLNPDI
jgi:tight adherence protein B